MSDTDDAGDAVVIERTFDAPIERVWQMWTVPEHFQAWYGPTGAVPSVCVTSATGVAAIVRQGQDPEMIRWTRVLVPYAPRDAEEGGLGDAVVARDRYLQVAVRNRDPGDAEAPAPPKAADTRHDGECHGGRAGKV